MPTNHQHPVTSNSRIAKNTLMLYIRMFVMILLGLYTTRITLQVLGVTDYGIYNAVGGMVAMLSVISGAMSVAISRYITVWVGKNDVKRLNEVFSSSLIIQSAVAILVVVLAEVIGVWFLNNKMVIPAERMSAAFWVLQCSIVAFAINLLSVPYNAAIIAHERMSVFAHISILEVVLKLLLVYTLYISSFDKLILYAVLLACLSLVMRLVYGIYCARNFEECHFRFFFDKSLLKEMFGFIGWTFWGNAVWTVREHGTNIMINMFCGPVVNAARGIAAMVNQISYNFVGNFLTAVNPQITKNYSVGNLDDMHKLILMASKFAFFIMLILFMPICANIDYLLNLWLVDIPPHTSSFIVIVLLCSLLNCLCQPLLVGLLAQGDIKAYEIVLTITYITNCVASYFILSEGFAPEWCFVLNFIFDVVILFTLLVCARIKYEFPIRQFVKKILSRVMLVFVICAGVVLVLPFREATTFIRLLINTTMIVILSFIIIIAIGITTTERQFIMDRVREKLDSFKK